MVFALALIEASTSSIKIIYIEIIDECIFDKAIMVFNGNINQYCMFVDSHKLLW
jgi:hypothetical protein